MNSRQIAIAAGVGVLIGGALGGISWYVLRERFAQRLLEDLDTEVTKAQAKTDAAYRVFNYACRQYYELRDALSMMVDQIQFDTILAQVDYKFGLLAKDPRNRYNLAAKDEFDLHIEHIHDHWYDNGDDSANRRDAVVVAQTLGDRSQVTEEEEPVVRHARHDRSKPDPQDIYAARMKEIREAAEAQWAEHEYPGEEVGMERMTPNGDILDDGYDDESYDPREEYSDEMPLTEASSEIDYGKRDKPYLISEFEYLHSQSGYQQSAITYYGADDTLVDEDETVMEQWVVGKTLERFESTEDPAIYVRNDQLEMEYEVIWDDGSYDHIFLGVPDTDITGKRLYRPWED